MRSKEDITTGILEYLLDSTNSSAFAVSFFNACGLKLSKYTTSQQVAIDNGRLDLCVYNDEVYIIIENKFDAAFTWEQEGGHQLQRYCNWISKQKQQNKRVIIITIQRRNKEISEYIEYELNNIKNIKVKIVIWNDILSDAIEKEEDDILKCITSQLKMFIEDNFSKKTSTEGVNMQALFSKDAGIAFGVIEELIDKMEGKIYEEYENPNLKRKNRFDGGSGSIGFYYKKGVYEYWFGMNPSVWEIKGSPLCLQLYKIGEKVITDCINEKKLLSKWLLKKYIEINGELNYVFTVNEIIDEDVLYTKIKELTI